ncbi:3-oxo-tetronate kinase [Salinicola halophilus]|uniref:3-oxo-tetronate kinase n=1 Tax=Salinicola halophilus TaxID=184065 RepID=UPI000DA1EFBD|nr:3-oxo-tetronate kinase [Salinicola halophilus]
MPFIGCIADDFTGGTDLANNLVKSGFRTRQTIGVPVEQPGRDDDTIDAVVVALKSRSLPASEAVEAALSALAWLRQQGCEKFYFKYCSTFDSTPDGNIGPVAEALMEALGVTGTLFCPAFPATGRTVYQGHLFVGDRLLNDSGMESHPLTPMADADLVRWLGRQSRRDVGLIAYSDLSLGEAAVRARIDALIDEGKALIVTDTLDDAHLDLLARASAHLPLVTGGSGLALGLKNLSPTTATDAGRLPTAAGSAVVLAGSASRRTREQIEHAATRLPTFTIDPRRLQESFDATVDDAIRWAEPQLGPTPLLIHSDTRPEAIEAAQSQLGVEAAGALIERAMATLAERLLVLGVRQWIVAGGETSGAIVQALGITSLKIGPEIAPGVPWTHAATAQGDIHLALKSGNFGAREMFTNAWEIVR